MKTTILLAALLLLAGCAQQADQTTSTAGLATPDTVREVHIEAGAAGYDPARLDLTAGEPVRLVFTRTTPSACLEQVQIPSFGIGPVDLPMNEPVAIELTPDEAGEYTFACGMDMQHGAIVVTARQGG